MVPQGGGGKGSVVDAALELLRSPAGAAWKVAHAFGEGLKKCEELARARKGECTPICDCCEVIVEHLSYTNLVGGIDVIVKPVRVNYWECTSCNDVRRYNDHRKKNPGAWPAGSANSWALTAREQVERYNTYDSFYNESKRYSFPQND